MTRRGRSPRHRAGRFGPLADRWTPLQRRAEILPLQPRRRLLAQDPGRGREGALGRWTGPPAAEEELGLDLFEGRSWIGDTDTPRWRSPMPSSSPAGSAKRVGKKVSGPPPQPSPPAIRQAFLLEQNDEWTVQRARYMTLEPRPIWAMIPSSACPSRNA